MKLIWTILINLAIFLILVAITICILLFTTDWNTSCDENPPSLEGYKNHQLFQFLPTTDTDVEQLIELQNKIPLIPWTNVLRKGWPFMIQVPPEQIKTFVLSSEILHLPFVLLSSNLQNYLTNRKRTVTDFKIEKSSDFKLNRYHYFDEIEKYLNLLAQEQKDRVILSSYGTSIENRQLYYVRIFKSIDEAANTNDDNEKGNAKKVLILECGMHSREWISTSSCLHFINYLIYDSESQPLLENYEFYILPMVNPDGYSYSWNKDRMWRKNRRRFANNCYGVDLNRNFNIGFNASEITEHVHTLTKLEGLGIDLSTNKTRFKRLVEGEAVEPSQCSNLYGGERPFSENETFYLKRFIDRFLKKPNIYISLHSYSQMWLYPYGIKDLEPQNKDKLEKFARIGVENLEKSRSKYNGTDSTVLQQNSWTYGSAQQILYNAGGISIDWALKDVGIDLVYTIEMRDAGFYGFLLPEDQIEPAAVETWSGIKAVLEAYANDSKDDNNMMTTTTTESTETN